MYIRRFLNNARSTNINTDTDTITRCYYNSLLEVILLVVGALVIVGETNEYYGGRKLSHKRTRPEKHA